MPVVIGQAEYPTNCLDRLHAACKQVTEVDATGMATACGTFKAANVVLLGVLAKKLPFKYEDWMNAIENNVKEKFIDMNKKAFDMGYNL